MQTYGYSISLSENQAHFSTPIIYSALGRLPMKWGVVYTYVFPDIQRLYMIGGHKDNEVRVNVLIHSPLPNTHTNPPTPPRQGAFCAAAAAGNPQALGINSISNHTGRLSIPVLTAQLFARYVRLL